MTKYYKNLEQRSKEWFEVRAGVASGTMMKQVISSGKTLQTCQYKVLAGKHIDDSFLPISIDFEDTFLEQKIRNGVELSGRDSANRGIELEPYAIEQYERETENKVIEMGFVKLDKHIGCSPDGLIKEGRHYVGAIEIKSLLGQNYIKMLMEGFMKSDHKPQALNYFICIPTLEWIDCVTFHPGASNKIGSFHIERLTRKELQDDIIKQFEKVAIYKKTLDSMEEDLLSKLQGERMVDLNENKMYGVKDVAHFMSVSTQTVRQWCKVGKLKSTNVGNEKRSNFRIMGSDILKLK